SPRCAVGPDPVAGRCLHRIARSLHQGLDTARRDMPSSAKSVASGASKPATKTPARKASPAKSVVDLAVVDGLLGAIYEGPTESPPWNSALQRLRDTLAAAHVTLILRPPSQDSTGVMINT